MAEKSFCDLSGINEISDALGKVLEKGLPEDSTAALNRYFMRTEGPSQGLKVEQSWKEIGVVKSQAPYAPTASWTQALKTWEAKLSNGQNNPALAPVWQQAEEIFKGRHGWLIDPRAAWGNPEYRATFSAALMSKNPTQARNILANFLDQQGYQSRASLLRNAGTPGGLNMAIGWIKVFGTEKAKLYSDLLYKDARVHALLDPEEQEMILKIMEDPEKWPTLQPLLNDTTSAMVGIADKYQEFSDKISPIVNRYQATTGTKHIDLGDIYGWLWKVMSDPEKARVERILRDYGLPESPDAKVQLAQQMQEAIAKDVKAQIEAIPHILPDWMHEAWNTWASLKSVQRTVGLIHPSFLTNNQVDILTRTKLAGRLYGGLKAYGQEAWAYVRAMYETDKLPISPDAYRASGAIPETYLDRIHRQYGGRIMPAEVMASFERSLSYPELQIIKQNNNPLYSLPLVKSLLGPAGAKKEDLNLAQRLARNPLDAIGFVFKWVRLLGTAQETAGRKQAYVSGFTEFLDTVGYTTFEERAREIFQANGLGHGEEFVQAFRSLPHKTPEDVEVLTQTLAPTHSVLSDQIQTALNYTINQAMDFGIKESERIHFDYLDKNNADEIMGNVFKYHFWATRNLPFYTEELARHYTIMKMWNRSTYYQSQDSNGSFVGSQVPILEKVFFWGPGRSYLALWSAVSVFDQLDPSSASYGTGYDRLNRQLGTIGLSPLFEWQLLANLMGYDTRSDPPRFAPVMGIPGRSTGADITFPISQTVRNVRAQTSGHLPGSKHLDSQTLTGSATFDRAVWRELIGMSYEETGRANHPRYMAAMADPSDPLFQEAASRVRKRRVPVELFNQVSPFRGSTQSETELALNQASHNEQPRTSQTQLVQDIKSGTPDLWRVYIPTDVREAQIRSGQALAIWLGAQGQAPTTQYLAQQMPWYLAYEYWARQQRSGQGNVNTFLDRYHSLSDLNPQVTSP